MRRYRHRQGNPPDSAARMTPMPAQPLTPAERQRRLRIRRKLGLLWSAAEVPAVLAEALVEAGLLSDDDAADPDRLGAALVTAGEEWACSQ